MKYKFLSKQIGGVTIITDSGKRVTLRPGINDLTAAEEQAVLGSKEGKYFVAENRLNAVDANPQPTPQPESGGDQSLAGVSYVPLTPTTEQLLPIDGIGPVKATTIINNTPEGGYTSPTQLIDINSLSLDESLIEVLFEIA